MAYTKNPVLSKDVLKLRLERRTRGKLVGACFDNLEEVVRTPLPQWKTFIGLDDEEVEEIIAFLKKHGLEHRVKK